MRIVDSVLAIVGLAGFAAFLGIIAVYVQEPVLVAIFIICTAMAAFDFFREIITKYGSSRRQTRLKS